MSKFEDANSSGDLLGGRMIVRIGEREWIWDCPDDSLLAAIDHTFRRRLTRGDSVYFSSDAIPEIGRTWATLVIPPSAFVSFSYTHHNGEDFNALTHEVQELVDRDGGLTVNADYQLIG